MQLRVIDVASYNSFLQVITVFASYNSFLQDVTCFCKL